MYRFIIRFCLLTALAAAGPRAHAAEPAIASTTLRLVVIGDSTVCDYPPESDCRGWGQCLQERFNDSVKVVNLARSGRSTKTFIKEGHWKKALAEKPDFVLIQFGHNDSHAAERPESTDAGTTYQEYLRQYIADCRAAGATPILVTPMHRRTFVPDGTLQDILRPYAEAMKAVAAEKQVAVIDLHTRSGELFKKLGPADSAALANKEGDKTHFNEKGARAMATLVLEALPKADARLAKALRDP